MIIYYKISKIVKVITKNKVKKKMKHKNKIL